jgi:hypothetical protein
LLIQRSNHYAISPGCARRYERLGSHREFREFREEFRQLRALRALKELKEIRKQANAVFVAMSIRSPS